MTIPFGSWSFHQRAKVSITKVQTAKMVVLMRFFT
jgi:hypothetical protein